DRASGRCTVATARPQVVSNRVATLPNLLSFLRLLFVPVFVVLIVNEHDAWALVVLALSSASDYLDGNLARRWNQVTRLGQVLDPFADRLYIVTTLLGLAYRGLIPWWLVIVLAARDALMLCTVPVLARLGHTVLPVHFLGKAGTFCLLGAFPLLLLAELVPALSVIAGAVGWAFVGWGTGLYWWAGILYVRQVVALGRVERSIR
ncbi:MAG: CDP-alcohol phosphatidyltransferase family protein, partial [Janthinobacterium lividum]